MTEDDWRPLAAVQALEKRGAIVWAIRQFFHAAGYVEVHTPTLSRDTVVDRYIDPVVVPGSALGCVQADAAQYYLQTSPEFGMKRLLAAGMKSIYQLGPAFRMGERGQHHNPEFSMLEWYRVDQPLGEALQFLGELVDHALAIAGNAMPPTEIVSYASVFQMGTGHDPLTCDDSLLPAIAREQGIQLGSSWAGQSRDDWLNLIFAECIQPRLGGDRPQLVTNYPASQAALAAVSMTDSRTADRYELFIRGVEIANGYRELLDPVELLARSRQVLQERRGDGKADLQLENRLLSAMRAGLPQACGCALGLDRLVMIALGEDHLDSVISFPIERA